MKTTKTIYIIIITLIITSCGASKKSTTTTTTTTEQPTGTFHFIKPSNGIYEPGNEELVAIQAQYADATLEQLKEGHITYSAGACINCHGAKNIYNIPQGEWKNIMDEMALKAKISDSQKDAVYKYVLAIKAAQPK